jgi:hypothetical protein
MRVLPTPSHLARLISATAFSLGYALVAIPVAGALLLASDLIGFRFGDSPAVPLIAAVATLCWHVTRTRSNLLILSGEVRCAAAGIRATVLDVLHFGIRRGAYCVGICWSAMFLMLLSGRFHLAVMLVVMIGLAAERNRSPHGGH